MMLLNKIMVFLGLALLAVLIIENMVMNQYAYLFWINNSSVWIVTFISSVIGAFIGFGFRGIVENKSSSSYENTDDFDF